jgi:hypothetical protein
VQGPFDTPIERDGATLIDPWREPRQMLGDQAYDGHTSIHDDATARTLAFRGGTIEGPTHFSQIVPLACNLWGERFLAQGCISARLFHPGEDEVIATMLLNSALLKQSYPHYECERAALQQAD